MAAHGADGGTGSARRRRQRRLRPFLRPLTSTETDECPRSLVTVLRSVLRIVVVHRKRNSWWKCFRRRFGSRAISLLIQVSATQLSLFLCIFFVLMATDRAREDAMHTSLPGSPPLSSSSIELLPMRHLVWSDEGVFILPALDPRSQILSIKDRRKAVGKPGFQTCPTWWWTNVYPCHT